MTIVDQKTLEAAFDRHVNGLVYFNGGRLPEFDVVGKEVRVYCDHCGAKACIGVDGEVSSSQIENRMPAGWVRVGMTHLCESCVPQQDGGSRAPTSS